MNNVPKTKMVYELQPLLPLVEWWQWATLLVGLMLLAAAATWLYRRDTRKLHGAIRVSLLTLRICTLVFILIYFLGPGKRSETRVVKDSRIAILVDTSLSMGLTDEANSESLTLDVSRPATRMNQITDWLRRENPVARLQEDHEVSVYGFDSESRPNLVASFPKRGLESETSPAVDENDVAQLAALRTARLFGYGAMVAMAICVLSFLVWASLRWRRSAAAPIWNAISLLSCLVVGVLLATCDLAAPNLDVAMSLGFKTTDAATENQESKQLIENVDDQSEVSSESTEWSQLLSARGGETRLGSAIEHVVNRERAGSIAGIVVVTDGQSNAGTLPQAAIAAASNAGIPLYPIGVGSNEMPRNVQVVDVQAPPRVFPGDRFQVKALVTAFGLKGSSVRVKLFSIDTEETEAEVEVAEESMRLGEDGEPTSISFELKRSEKGKRKYIVRVTPLEQERVLLDNQRSAVVNIIERKTNVLLIAGGPTREFRFLRNQLYRDKSITTHVWLQSAQPGADQESDVLLDTFPQTRNEMYFFDCVIAFDPDWRDLSGAQTELLERWVAEQAGGFIVVAGPVNTPEWTRRPRGDAAIDALRKLYPVSFYSQGSSVLKLGRFGGDTAHPLQFTREGRAAEFLWLGDSAAESLESWQSFDGVFGYYAVNESKAGADVLANFADPNTMVGDRLPIYLASQFYGAGRVFFQASGEIWRMRRLDVDYFESYYNGLIRWASQGRLMRDSKRGVLLVDKQRCWLGDNISVQAVLRDSQDNPLTDPEVGATILLPDGTTEPIVLRSNAASVSRGTYSAQLIAAIEGDYRITLPIPDSPDLEILSSSFSASIPDLEKERPQRNDPLLLAMAEQTAGHYYVGMEQFSVEQAEETSPENLIQPRDQETILAGSLDLVFKRKLLMWLLGLLTLTLSLEWMTRRLNRLA